MFIITYTVQGMFVIDFSGQVFSSLCIFFFGMFDLMHIVETIDL